VSARDEVLARVRRAQSGAIVEVPRHYVTERAADVELFVERVSDYRADVHRTSDDALPGVLRDLLAGSVVVPEGLPAEWITQITAEVRHEPLTSLELDRVDAVITGCAVGICETGTLVLDTGPGQGRRALSLVPDHHVLVVREGQLVSTVSQALARLDPTRPLTWISGPSATSDIELQRVEGVHGPRRISVVVVR
jgi:L-lactate dehydrogenase complex protein LldG